VERFTGILPEMLERRPLVPPLPADAAPGVHHRHLAPRQYAWVAGAALVVAAALHWLGPVLTPFLIGAILAYLGNPIVNRCHRLGISRTLGTVIAVLVMGLLLFGLMVVLVPLIQAEVTILVQRLPVLAEQALNRVTPWVEENFGITLQFDLATLKELIAENAESAKALSLQMLAGVKSWGLVLIGILVNIALIPVVMFYLLRDWHFLIARIDDLIPRRWLPLVRQLAHDIDKVLAEFLHGQMLVMVSLAAYYSIALSLAGLQFSLPIGILTGLLVFIPYVGFGLGFILGMMAALLQWSGWPGFIAIVAVYGVGQLLENYVLIPFLVGKRIGLHPLAVIFALLAFAQLFGFAGVLLALPASAALLVGLRHLRATYTESPMYREI
jgi:predicted PurR-regulated permease PerM